MLTDLCTNLVISSERYQVLYGRYFNRFFDNKKISKFVNTSAWLTPNTGLRNCLEEFISNPKFLEINWKKEALIDKAAHEWTPLREIPSKKMKLMYLKWRLFGVKKINN